MSTHHSPQRPGISERFQQRSPTTRIAEGMERASPRDRGAPPPAAANGFGSPTSPDSDQDKLRNYLPSAWKCTDNHADIMRQSPLRLKRKTREDTHMSELVVANRVIPADVMDRIARQKPANKNIPGPLRFVDRRSTSAGNQAVEHSPGNSQTILTRSVTTPQDGAASTGLDAYYFEITVKAAGSVCIGLVPSHLPEVLMSPRKGTFPGALPGSIGLSSDGVLFLSGVPQPSWTEPFRSGDTVGCGIEISASGNKSRIFFTLNGRLLYPPSHFRGVEFFQNGDVVPAVGLMTDRCEIEGNFGLEKSFRWQGSHGIGYFSPNDTVPMPSAAGLPTVPYHYGTPSDRNIRLEDDDDDDDEPEHSQTYGLRPGALKSDSSMNSQEQEQMRRAIEQSTARTPSYLQQLSIAPKDIEDAKADARDLRGVCERDHVDMFLMQNMLAVCRSHQERVMKKLEDAMKFPDVNLEELIAVNEVLLESISVAEAILNDSTPCEHRPTRPFVNGAHGPDPTYEEPQSPTSPESRKPRAKMSFEVEALIRKKDVFSLICMLRSNGNKRLDAAIALMRFVRQAEKETDDDSLRLRNEIRSSGGMHSLLVVFRAKGASHELQAVAAMAVAYLLPSVVQGSSSLPSNIGLKVIECLRFLMITKEASFSRADEITHAEMNEAGVAGTLTMWSYVLFPLLNQDNPGNADTSSGAAGSSPQNGSMNGRRRPRLLRVGSLDRIAVGSQMTLEMRALLEATVSLVVCMAKVDSDSVESRMRYTVIEQMCAIDVARPIAVRESLLKLLAGWINSSEKDKIRCAVTSIRHFTSTEDMYMAGWVHSQILNEGALTEISKLSVSDMVGHEVRLSVAEILSNLCGAPHTRAAVVEAKCINYLIPLLLMGHSDPLSQQIEFAAGSALLQLLSGAMARARVFRGDSFDLSIQNVGDTVISDIVYGGAIDPFVTMASSDDAKLRSMSIEALLVLSEDEHPFRVTRLRLCNAGAGSALGMVLKEDIGEANKSNDHLEAYKVLCALSNVLDIDPSAVMPDRSGLDDPLTILEKCCAQVASSGGLESLLRLASKPANGAFSSDPNRPIGTVDLLVEACHSLALLSQLLLSEVVASEGYSAWACEVLSTLTKVWKEHVKGATDKSGLLLGLGVDVLRGIGALAASEALKVRIVDKSLPALLETKLNRADGSELADAASQVVVALGFPEEEVAVQVAGNDPKLLADWFCLNRSLLIQAMVREEIRKALDILWTSPLNEARSKGMLPPLLTRESSDHSGSGNRVRGEGDSLYKDLFEFLSEDEDTANIRDSVIQQYHSVYEDVHRSISGFSGCEEANAGDGDVSLLSGHSYPLGGAESEKEWILSHRGFLEKCKAENLQADDVVGVVKDRLQRLLEPYMPSRALQSDILPILNLRPDASFNFRAVAMPQRRYFSFQREGQLLRRLCEKHMATAGTSAIHWTVAFANSSFAGEFSETLVTALYRCPMIRGLSFMKKPDDDDSHETRSVFDGDEGAGKLANLAGALPPGVSCLTYDNVLNDRAVESLVAILTTVDRLSEGQVVATTEGPRDFDRTESSETTAKQGSFWFFALRNSPHLGEGAWASFFGLIGRPPKSTSMRAPPLASLRVLDLSGNDLNDDQCAFVLQLAHDRYSRCGLEQLDLSGNSIGKGKQVAKVLRAYAERFRFNQTSGVRMSEKCWKSSLHTLSLASNSLHEGSLALEIFALLKHNAFSVISLDLSNNKLDNAEHQVADVLGGSLVKNTRIRHLDLSGNNFDAGFVDGLLTRLSQSEADSSLGFLRLDHNMPPLSKAQSDMLADFSARCRATLLDRYLKDNTQVQHGRDSLLEVEDDESFAIRQSMAPSPETVPQSARDVFADARDLSNASIDMERKTSGGAGENMITVLFSAPLVFKDEHKQLRPFAKLDFDMERELMWQCLKEASRDIDLSFDNATDARLLAAVAKRCSCLHYSGHGHQTFLPLENGKGGPHWLKVDVLKDLINQGGGAPFKFVFVSACYSGLAGETFASAGVPHVVCCQQESELKDAAALAFTRQFYLALAVGHTVQDSFEQGCKAVLATPNIRNPDEEMKKFILLPKDGNHQVPIFDARPISEWPRRSSSRSGKRAALRRGSITRSRSNYLGGARSFELTVRNMMQENPSPTPPQCFSGREVDMFHILGAILGNRLVSVVGETGIGRSSTARALCHYINERRNTITQIERIHFVRINQGRGGERCNLAIRQLLTKITEDKKVPALAADSDMDSVFDGIWRHLKHGGALIVFDRIELLDGSDDTQDFVMFLSNLFQETHKNVRVMLTGSKALGIPSIGGVVERPYELGPLNFESTVRLFTTLCPHLHTPSERKQLFARLVGDSSQADVRPNDEDAPDRIKGLFSKLGNGVPAKIEKVASAITSEEVARLGVDA